MSAEARYTKFQMQTRKGMSYYVYNGDTEVYRSPSESARDAYYDRLTAPTAAPVETATPTAPAMAPGWSTAAKARSGRPVRRDVVGDALGLVSSARPGDCHYTGLDINKCDCCN